MKYIGKDGIFKKICREAKRNLYSANKKKKADFNTVYGMFKEKYENGSDFSNLINIQHETNNLIYHYGKQKNDRKIDINKIKEIFESAKKYSSAVEFNKDYKGNSALKGYYFNFYKELIKIKEDYEDENRIQNGINNNFPNYVLIIDEINRGNISKIFGELITLIEEDKRIGAKHELTVKLPYSQNEFGIPKNLYIIGTMNTSDRSIASVDIALRRRFTFKEIMPNLELLNQNTIGGINLNNLLKILNERITVLLDRDHQIGHSYFMNVNDVNELKEVWFNSVIPLLNEYFYGDWEKLQMILGEAKEGAFIKKIKATFAHGSCEDDCFDFNKENIDFIEALRHAKLINKGNQDADQANSTVTEDGNA